MTYAEAINKAKELSKTGCTCYVLQDYVLVDGLEVYHISAEIDVLSFLLRIGYEVIAAYENGVKLNEEDYIDKMNEDVAEYNRDAATEQE